MVFQMPDSFFIKIKNSATGSTLTKSAGTDGAVTNDAETAGKEPVHTVLNVASAVDCASDEPCQPAIALDGAMGRIETGKDLSPPWKQPRSVVESGGQSFKGQVSSAEYPALKKRLVTIPTRSAHSRQSLYRDKYTGQFWLGLRACIGSWSQQTEVLKPLGYEVAESLSASNRGLSDMMVH